MNRMFMDLILVAIGVLLYLGLITQIDPDIGYHVTRTSWMSYLHDVVLGSFMLSVWLKTANAFIDAFEE